MSLGHEESKKITTFTVQGMDCNDEVVALKHALNITGVYSIEPNIMHAKIEIVHDERVENDTLISKIESTGVKVQKSASAHSQDSYLIRRSLILGLSGVVLGVALLVSNLWNLSIISMTLAIISAFISGALIIPKALRSVRTLQLDMNVLMTIAVLGAMVIGEYIEGATVIFLFSLAELLEGYSLERARRSIQSLLKLSPETALVKREQLLEVPVREIEKNEIIIVKSGSRIPLDGIVHSGNSNVNQAPITGESLPVAKKVGDRVLAGTLNEEGSLEVLVTQTFNDTKLSQIIRLIEDAQKQKAPTQRFVDTFARYYTPIVFIGAIFVFLVPPIFFGGNWNDWFYKSLVLLVIACPCALVITTPVSIVSGLTALARRGVLIKGGAGLEAIGKLKALAVDKTGTITQGVPKVLKVFPQGNNKENDVLTIAASIDFHSTHPLAKAVVSAAIDRKLLLPQSANYRATTGRGAEAVIDGHLYFVGNHKFAHENAVCSIEIENVLNELENNAQSVVIVGHRPHEGCIGEVIGILGIADPIREDATASIQALHRAGIQSVVMLSGDNLKTAIAISRQVGIDEVYGDLLPSDKVLKVHELKNRFGSVGMIGDGVNDAPAMASATLGIAMGATGTDTAIETSDVTLMRDNLLGVAEGIQIGKKTLSIIWFNTAFAILIKAVFLVLSLLGYSSLWMAIAADTGATLIVIANALRILGYKPKLIYLS